MADNGDCPDHRQAATGDFCLTEEQADVLELDHNIAITAGAGTGKTTALTERYIHILEENPGIGPEEIVTITFTNDAANELQDRIRSAVGDRLTDADTESYTRWRTVKDDLDDGYIHTIHGFCARILREQAVDAPIRPDMEVYDETDAAVLARDVIRDELGDLLTNDNPDVRRLAHLWDRETLEDILVGLLQQRPESETWATHWSDRTPEDYMDFVWREIHPITPTFADDVCTRNDVVGAFDTLQSLKEAGILSDISQADDDGADTVATVTELIAEFRPLDDNAGSRQRQHFLDQLCEYLTTNEGERDGRDYMYWGSKGRWGDAGYEAEQAQLEEAVETLFEALQPEELDFGVEADRASGHYVVALARLFKRVAAAYQTVKDQQNVLDYDDLIEVTIDFLQANSELRTRLREQFAYVMVDEVQDTDPRQWELVQLLTSHNPESFDAQNVFLVGDEKQSIYRFRGADVTSFETAREELTAANPDSVRTSRELSGNFRTVGETLDFCNDLFDGDRLFKPFEDEYLPFEAQPQKLSSGRREGTGITGQCEYLFVPDDDYLALHGSDYLESTPMFTETGDREAYAIASRLTQLFDEPPDIYDEQESEIRSAGPEDVCILLRSRTRLKSYERALDEYDIPYSVVTGTGYYDTPEIRALLNLFRVLENPNDEIALYGILRSPLFGIPDDTIAQLKQDNTTLWDALSTAGGGLADGGVKTAYDVICQWRRSAGVETAGVAASTTPWATLLSEIIDETGFMASIAGDERPRQAVVNVNRFREQVRRWEEAGIKTISDLRSRLELRQDIETHADEAAIPEDIDGVEIRTVHSAKGLEFPIVVVPELGKQFNFGSDVDDNGKVLFDDLPVGPDNNNEPVVGIKSPTPADAFEKKDTLARRVLRDQIRHQERAELKRLLYVATTRVRDHLILSGIHDIEESDESFQVAESQPANEADCWRDWVQPVLLDPETTPERLASSDSIGYSLDRSSYRVRRPTAPVPDWEQDDSRPTPSLQIDIPSPREFERRQTLSATEYAARVTGDQDGYLEDSRNDAGESHHDGLSPTTLGSIVHRICETRLPESEWQQFTSDVATQENESTSDEDLSRIQRYVSRALAFQNEYESPLEIQSVHRELSVTAVFDGAEIIGDIDHLIVTPSAYYILDYKTNRIHGDLDSETVSRYWPQLEVYGAALHQNDPDRSVEMTLFFADADEARTRHLKSEELAELQQRIESKCSTLL